MKNCLCLFSIVFLFACNNNTKEDAEVIVSKDTTEDVTNRSTATNLDGCYISVFKRDSANLYISMNKNDVSGTLNYKLYEKDSNTGTISGQYKNSLIIVNYTFQSEGVSSTREVVFKVANGGLLEGHGEFEMKGDTAKFKDISQLIYPEEYRFIKTKCP